MAGTWNVAGVATCIHPPLPGRQAHVGFTRNTCKQNQRPSIVGTPLVCVPRLLCASRGSCVRPAALVCVPRLLCASRGSCVRPARWATQRDGVRSVCRCASRAVDYPTRLCASCGLAHPTCMPASWELVRILGAGAPNAHACVLRADMGPAGRITQCVWSLRDAQ